MKSYGYILEFSYKDYDSGTFYKVSEATTGGKGFGIFARLKLALEKSEVLHSDMVLYLRLRFLAIGYI